MSGAGRVDQVIDRQFDRFGLLLVLLVASFLVSGVDTGREIRVVTAALNIGVIVIGFASTGADLRRWTSVTVAAIWLVASVGIARLDPTAVPGALASFGQALVLGVIMAAVLKRILRGQSVTLQSILAAISVYFLIGLSFAWVYLGLRGLADGPVLDPPSAEVPAYYSFVVLTTLGFGDVTPVGELAKRVTVIEAIAGQIFLATLVARLVSMYGQGDGSVDRGEGPNGERAGADDGRGDGGEGETRLR